MDLPVRGDGALILGELEAGDRLAAWSDGETVDLVDGFQGGYMVTPAVALPGDSVSCATVRLEASVDGNSLGAGVFAGSFQASFDGGSVSQAFPALLGFDADSLVGGALTLTAIAYTEEWRSEPDTRTVVLGAPN